jgi:hypothetical protein
MVAHYMAQPIPRWKCGAHRREPLIATSGGTGRGGLSVGGGTDEKSKGTLVRFADSRP